LVDQAGHYLWQRADPEPGPVEERELHVLNFIVNSDQ